MRLFVHYTNQVFSLLEESLTCSGSHRVYVDSLLFCFSATTKDKMLTTPSGIMVTVTVYVYQMHAGMSWT